MVWATKIWLIYARLKRLTGIRSVSSNGARWFTKPQHAQAQALAHAIRPSTTQTFQMLVVGFVRAQYLMALARPHRQRGMVAKSSSRDVELVVMAINLRTRLPGGSGLHQKVEQHVAQFTFFFDGLVCSLLLALFMFSARAGSGDDTDQTPNADAPTPATRRQLMRERFLTTQKRRQQSARMAAVYRRRL